MAKRFSLVSGNSVHLNSQRWLTNKEPVRTRGWLMRVAASLRSIPLAVMLLGGATVFGAVAIIGQPGIVHGARGGVLTKPEDTLIVWAGDKAHVAPDFIAVVDFDEQSPTYG